MHPRPVPKPERWLDYVNEPQTEAEVERLRECLRRGRPFGSLAWMSQTARLLGLEGSLRPLGRLKKARTASPGPFGDNTDPE